MSDNEMQRNKDGNVMENGIVYVLSNPAMPGLYKIGITGREELRARLRELYANTSIPVPFECEYARRIDNYKQVEKALHTAFRTERVNPEREFFRTEPDRVRAVLELFPGEDVTPEVRRDIDKDTTPTDKSAGERLKKIRRPPLNFEEMKIPVNSILKFERGNLSIQASVSSSKRVLYEGQEYSLTALTRKLLKIPYAVAPCSYWTFNGRNLDEIYEETYPIEE